MILADISGIQEFVFNVPREEGGQAKMLRARSFYIQLFTECAARKVAQNIGVSKYEILFCAAGKFAIDTSSIQLDNEQLYRCKSEIEDWLILNDYLLGQIRFSMVWDEKVSSYSSILNHYEAMQTKLRIAKYTSWLSVAVKNGKWDSSKLCLSVYEKKNEELFFEKLGENLALEQYDLLIIKDKSPNIINFENQFDLLNHETEFYKCQNIPTEQEVFAFIPLKEMYGNKYHKDKRIDHPLLRHVPRESGKILSFKELANRATGAPYLGVLKMDADSMGEKFKSKLIGKEDFKKYKEFSNKLDDFFSKHLNGLMMDEYKDIYTIFSGGDDLLLVGPWNKVLDFTYLVRNTFCAKFKNEGLTISGGLSIVRDHFPIRFAADQAEKLLKQAKTEKAINAESTKDQLACLGQVWKWKDHEEICKSGKQLICWILGDSHVEKKVVQRGWLTTLLELAELRACNDIDKNSRIHPALAASRLAYHITRNWTSQKDGESKKARAWIDEIAKNFIPDEEQHVNTVFLPSIVCFAMLATRPFEKENKDE